MLREFPLARPGVARRPGLILRLRRWLVLHRQRRHLARLDAHLLRDIGLTRAEAEDEAARAPWDVPQHWRG